MPCIKQKTITIKPVFGNSNTWRILYWTVTYKGKVLHSSPSIYSEVDYHNYYFDMQKKAKELGATHIKNWLCNYSEKAN